MQQIDKQDTQTTYGQEHADQKHNVSECAVNPVVNAAHLFLPCFIFSGSDRRVKVKSPSKKVEIPQEETMLRLRKVLRVCNEIAAAL